MSRCGSTLLLNALKAAERVVGLGEAIPMSRMVALAASRSKYWAKVGSELLAPLTSVFAHFQDSTPKNVVIKCSTEAVFSMRALRAVWPQVPFLILIRNPIEVLVSNWQKAPQWIQEWKDAPERLWPGPAPDAVTDAGGTELCAWLLGRFCAEALPFLDDRCIVIDYDDLTPEVVRAVAANFGLHFSPQGEERFCECFQNNAKELHRRFDADRDSKQRVATDAMRRSAAKWMEPAYKQVRRHAVKLHVGQDNGAILSTGARGSDDL
jgi:hypothetical protein